MYVEPTVVRAKVDREVRSYVDHHDDYRNRGIWLLEYSFPTLHFAFVAKNHKPYPLVLFGVAIDFENYDIQAPSIKFVDPLTRRPLKNGEIRAPFLRAAADGQSQSRLIQGWTPEDDRPFICLQGVREYHNNPGHSGDPWLLHRAEGVGRLAHLLDTLARYGSEPVVSLTYQIQVVPTADLAIGGVIPK